MAKKSTIKKKTVKSKAGRKPVADKKVVLTLYPRESQIKAAGGMEKAKKICLEALPPAKPSKE